jgi:hypothetical protein
VKTTSVPPPALRGNIMPPGQNLSRRFTSRVAAPSDLWAFWNCKKHDGLSRVLDLSLGGLCLSLEKSERLVVEKKFISIFLRRRDKSELMPWCDM